MAGFEWLHQLSDPEELLAALRAQRRRLEESPENVYEAFTFFVAAEYLLYRCCPGYTHRHDREHLLKTHPELRVGSMIAAGTLPIRAGGEDGPAWVALEGDVAEHGESGDVAHLADRVLDFWERHPRG